MVFVVNVSTGAILGRIELPEKDAQAHLAFGPRHLAVATGPMDQEGLLQVYRLGPHGLNLTAQHSDSGSPYGLAWGPGGLAMSTMRTAPWPDGARTATVVVFREAPSLTAARTIALGNATLYGDLAWSPDGGRIALGDGGRLKLLDLASGSVVDGGAPGGLALPGPAALLVLAGLAGGAVLARGGHRGRARP